MKYSLDWLRSYVDLPEEPAELAEHLAAAGFPVDSMEAWGADHRLDVDVLANRPDCMCHIGLARELGARLGRPLRIPESHLEPGSEKTSDQATVRVQDADLCPRYTALLISGVRVGPSPDWLVDRLASLGARPINNIVDVTNFVLHEYGQPLHAFDLERLTDRTIVVRRAEEGETLTTLDGEERSLLPSHLVIADARRPVALAGVMGGLDSEIQPGTTQVLLESAHFDPICIRRMARQFSMHTDASHLFERGTDIGITRKAARRAAALIVETAGGQVARDDLDVTPAGAGTPRRLSLSLQRLEQLLGMPVTTEQASSALSSLGFTARALPAGEPSGLEITVPTWRVDVTREVDLIEEVGRLLGYDQIPLTLPRFNNETAIRERASAFPDRGRRVMAAIGFREAINFPMTDAVAQEPFQAPAQRPVCLDNPLSSQMNRLRSSLLPGLLANLAHNLNRGQEDLRLFEVGHIYSEPSEPDVSAPLPLPDQRDVLAAVACGGRHSRQWNREARPLDFYDMKGFLETLVLDLWRGPVESLLHDPESLPPFLDPDEAARVQVGETPIGCFGRLHARLAGSRDLPDPVYVLEIDLSSLDQGVPPVQHHPLPRRPAVERDLALILAPEIGYRAVEGVVRKHGGEWLEAVWPFDRYSGGNIPEGKISMAVRMVFRHPERTLTADEMGPVVEGIVGRLKTELGAVLRDF